MGTNYLAATPPCISLSNGGVKDGPLRLNVLSLPCNATEALREVEVEELADWGLRHSQCLIQKLLQFQASRI